MVSLTHPDSVELADNQFAVPIQEDPRTAHGEGMAQYSKRALIFSLVVRLVAEIHTKTGDHEG